jgi:hypothetical protein
MLSVQLSVGFSRQYIVGATVGTEREQSLIGQQCLQHGRIFDAARLVEFYLLLLLKEPAKRRVRDHHLKQRDNFLE